MHPAAFESTSRPRRAGRRPLAVLARYAILALAVAMLGSTGVAHSQAIAPDAWVPDGPVNAMATLGDTLYLGGSFNRVAPRTGGGMPVDLTMGLAAAGLPRVHGQVYAVVADGVGGWFIGGAFDSVGNVPRANVAHILSNLTVAAWAPVVNDIVYSLALSSSTLYMGGTFQTVNGTGRAWLAAVNSSTGGLMNWDAAPDGPVYVLGVNGTRLYAAGLFFMIGGQFRSYLASLELTTAAVSTWAPEPDGFVWALAFAPGVVYAGGDFTHVGLALTARGGGASWSTSTGALNSWDPDVQGTINALAVSGSTVYVGGNFPQVHAQARGNLAAVSASNGSVSNWNPNIGGIVLALRMNGANLLVGGDFATAGTQKRLNLAAVDASGNVLAWDPGTDGPVGSISLSTTAAYIGGGFNSGGGYVRRNLAALNLKTRMPTLWNPDPDQPVDAITLGTDTLGTFIYVGGRFATIGGAARPKLAKLRFGTGTAITTFNAQCDGNVTALASLDTVVYVGGAFGHVGGATRAFLGAVKTYNGTAMPWAPASCNNLPYAIAATRSGVFVGGSFTTPRLRLARFELGAGALSSWNADADGIVYALAPLWETLYVGGAFRNLKGQLRSRLGGVGITTGTLSLWNPSADSTVRALRVSANFLVMGGSFTSVSGQPRSRLAAVRGVVGDPPGILDWAPAASGDVYALAPYGAQTAVGGAFFSIGGIAQSFLAIVGSTASTTLDAPATPDLVAGIALAPVAPNPVRTSARVRFTLPRAATVSLGLFDIAGRRNRTILDGVRLGAGPHEAAVPAAGAEPGIYFLRLEADGEARTRKVTIVR